MIGSRTYDLCTESWRRLKSQQERVSDIAQELLRRRGTGGVDVFQR
jgi:hypothetical protein